MKLVKFIIRNLPQFPHKKNNKEKTNVEIAIPLEGLVAEEVFRMIKNKIETENKTY